MLLPDRAWSTITDSVSSSVTTNSAVNSPAASTLGDDLRRRWWPAVELFGPGVPADRDVALRVPPGAGQGDDGGVGVELLGRGDHLHAEHGEARR